MENKFDSIIDSIVSLRKEYFGVNEEVYKYLGAAMGRLIDARDCSRSTSARL